MKKWEYLVVEGLLRRDGLDSYGAAGWELIHVIHEKTQFGTAVMESNIFIFKRELKKENKKKQ